MRRTWLAASATLVLMSCTTSRPLPDGAHAHSLIDYLQALRRETSTLLDRVVAATTAPTEEYAGFRAWGDHWCPRHAQIQSTDDVARQVALVCSARDGTYTEPYCRQTSDPENVLFFAQFRRGIDLCQGVAATVSVQVVEPQPGMTHSADYLDRLRTFGYRSRGDGARDALAALKADESERARLARELPRLRTRGTRVCHRHAGVMYAGFVEDTAEVKIKISVQEAYYVGPGQTVGARSPTYRPETIWDQPDRWFVCE